jgi:hypothetical protein
MHGFIATPYVSTHAGTLSIQADDGDCGRLPQLKPQLAAAFHTLSSGIVDNHQLPFPLVRVVRDEEVRWAWLGRLGRAS